MLKLELGVKPFLRLLFGVSDMSPLGRRAFIRATLGMFLVRWPVLSCLAYLLFLIIKSIILSDFIILIFFMLCIVFVCMFYIPYIITLHRRILYLRFPFPRLFLCFVVMYLIFIIGTLSADIINTYSYNKDVWTHGILEFLTHTLIYLLLLPWPDSYKKCE